MSMFRHTHVSYDPSRPRGPFPGWKTAIGCKTKYLIVLDPNRVFLIVIWSVFNPDTAVFNPINSYKCYQFDYAEFGNL